MLLWLRALLSAFLLAAPAVQAGSALSDRSEESVDADANDDIAERAHRAVLVRPSRAAPAVRRRRRRQRRVAHHRAGRPRSPLRGRVRRPRSTARCVLHASGDEDDDAAR